MTKEELQIRISKKQNDIAKIEKRIEKWTSGMNAEAKQIVANCELIYNDSKLTDAINKYKEYKKEHEYDSSVFRQDSDWNKGPDFEEAYRAYRDLAENKFTLQKYITQLDKLDNFNNMEKIQVLWKFLQNWRKDAYNYFIENIALYKKLKDEQYDKRKEYLNSDQYKKQAAGLNEYGKKTLLNIWDRKYYEDIHSITKNVYLYNGKWDDKRLNNILDKDVQNKYTDLVNRITEKAGVIQDVSGLMISYKGDINGIVIGDKNKVKVETIRAGGYNIQCLHYRTLVNIIN